MATRQLTRPFRNRISVRGNTCSFKLKCITCFPTSEERKTALAKQLTCLHSSRVLDSTFSNITNSIKRQYSTILLTATTSPESPQKLAFPILDLNKIYQKSKTSPIHSINNQKQSNQQIIQETINK